MSNAPWGFVDSAEILSISGSGDSAMARIADGQFGYLTTAQLQFAGISPRGIGRRVQRGTLRRVHRGVYLVGHAALRPEAPIAAAVLALGPLALGSHSSAGFAWGFAPLEEGPVHVSVPMRSPRSRRGIHVHRMTSHSPQDRRRRLGLPVTSPAMTVLDIAEHQGPAAAESAINEALQRRLITRREIESVIARTPGRHGLAWLLPLFRARTNDDFSRRKAEKILWDLIRSSGLPTPRRNVRAHGFELDFFWPELGLNVETDGYQWHSARHRLNADRDRDTKLSSHGIQVIRFSWDQLQRPNEVLARLAAAIALAAAR